MRRIQLLPAQSTNTLRELVSLIAKRLVRLSQSLLERVSKRDSSLASEAVAVATRRTYCPSDSKPKLLILNSTLSQTADSYTFCYPLPNV